MKTQTFARLRVGLTLALVSLVSLLATSARADDVLDQSGVSGAGSTFVYPLLSRWSREYRAYQAAGGPYASPNSGLEDPLPSTVLAYEPIGSLAGQMRVKNRAVDFGASDVPLPVDELQKAQLEQFPIVIGGVVIAVNLGGVGGGEVRLTGPVLAQIFLGRIARWSDPAIKTLNPSVTLPDTPIAVLHRADGSGTTSNFTAYLSRVSPEWKQKVGNGLLVSFPTGKANKGNEGIARAVKASAGAIGYVEFAQASQLGLTTVRLQNGAGTFVAPSPKSFQAAAASVDWSKVEGFDVLLVDASGPDAYPLTATVFALVHKKAPRARMEPTIDFFRWALEHGAETAKRLGYVPLPATLVQRVTKHWETALGIVPPRFALY